MSIKLFWWQGKRNDKRENYGDLMSKYIVEKVSNKPIKTISHPSKFKYKYLFKHYLAIGSIISNANKNSIIWGSGIIKSNDNISKSIFKAVRGPLTRKRILDLGYSCPNTYGDPALLMPIYYKKKVKKKYQFGIIPHYVDYKEVSKHFNPNEKIKIIDLLTLDIEKTTDEILECEQIISSSLHGVIVAHAYKIPALWIKFSNQLFGDDIKFFDYFKSVNITLKESIHIGINEFTIRVLKELLEEHKSILNVNEEVLIQRQKDLLNSCPF